MANVGSGDIGSTLIGDGNGKGPIYAPIGTNSGLTDGGVVVSKGDSAFVSISTIGGGRILRSGAPSSDPSWSNATYPSSTTVNQILYSSAANTVSGLATANNGVLTTGTTGIPVITPLASNGQLIIGSGSGAPSASTLTAGAGVVITNGSGSITLALNGSSITSWTDKNTSFPAVASNGYFSTDTLTMTLPSSPSQGDTIGVVIQVSSTTLTIQANTGQKIQIGSAASSVAGSVTSDIIGTSLILVYNFSASCWFAVSCMGSWNAS